MLLLAAPAAVQEQPADVIVTGRTAKAAAASIRRLTATVTRPSGDQVARFEEPLCVEVYGFAEPFGEQLAERVRAVARSAGLAIAPPRCGANLRIVVADDLVAYADRERRAGRSAPNISEAERLALRAGTVPALVWSETSLRSRDGERVIGGFLNVQDASILNLPTRIDLASATVVFAAPALLGKTLTQIADYAAMRSLARTNPGAARPDDVTILRLFDDATAERTLSTFDRAYLDALYHGPNTGNYLVRTSQLTRSLKRKGVDPRREKASGALSPRP